MSVRAFNDRLSVKAVFELDFIQTAQIALQSLVMIDVQRKEDLSPGILSGSERICLS